MMEEGVEGITILGGEPFEQAAACVRLARHVRSIGGSVVTYSGYTWAYLRRCQLPEVQDLVAATDLLIAGPFVSGKLTDGRGWHGSTNQEFVFLTDRYDDSIRSQFAEAPTVEVWTDGRIADWTGIPGEPVTVADKPGALSVLRSIPEG
jgi:anaerobic ribonucleoside-triphosphate reductase activating protein